MSGSSGRSIEVVYRALADGSVVMVPGDGHQVMPMQQGDARARVWAVSNSIS